jgi:hypothetical protein
VIEKAHDALAFDDASGTVTGALSPLRYLVKPQAVLDSWPMDCDYELRHRPNLCGELVGTEFRDR